jgi:hypothetical protein
MDQLTFATVLAADIALLSAYKTGNELELHDCLLESESILNSIMAQTIPNHDALVLSMVKLARHIEIIKSY